MPQRIEVIGLSGMPEVRPGDDLAGLILLACRDNEVELVSGDVLVVTQKIVSKAEGRLVRLEDVVPSPIARRLAEPYGKDARAVEVALLEAARIVRSDRGVLITETEHGFVCANSAVDASNLGEPATVALLPLSPDRSAAALRERIRSATSARIAVVISDTFGRPWREGATNVAIGVSGLKPLADYRGERDPAGQVLATTVIAVVDELAGAAELVMGKLDRVPVAVIRGYAPVAGDGDGHGAAETGSDGEDPDPGISPLLRKPEYDLFR